MSSNVAGGNFSRGSFQREFSRGIFHREFSQRIDKMTHRLPALALASEVLVVSQVLLETRTRGQHRCLRQLPAKTRGHFRPTACKGHSDHSERRRGEGRHNSTGTACFSRRGRNLRICRVWHMMATGGYWSELERLESARMCLCSGLRVVRWSCVGRGGHVGCYTMLVLRRDGVDDEDGQETGPRKEAK